MICSWRDYLTFYLVIDDITGFAVRNGLCYYIPSYCKPRKPFRQIQILFVVFVFYIFNEHIFTSHFQ